VINAVTLALKEDRKQLKRARNMFLAGQITKEEFGMCIVGRAEITGNRIRYFRASSGNPVQYLAEVRMIDSTKFRKRPT
jgi:hypothetical protein